MLAVEQFFSKTESADVRNAHRIQDSVQMIAFVLHYARMETADSPVNRCALFVITLIADILETRHKAAQTG